MARLLIASLLLAAATVRAEPAVPSPHAIDIPKWFNESFLDLGEDIREAARHDKRLLLYFGQDGCPYCKALMKVNFGDPEIVALTRKGFSAVALNLWGDREVTWIDGRRMSEKNLGRELRVQFTPTLLFFDEQGGVVLRLNGYSPKDKFRQALDYAAGRMEIRQAFTDYVAGLPPDGPRSALLAEPFFEPGAVDVARLSKASARPVLAVVERTSCRDCVEMHREGFARPEVRAQLARLRVVQVDLLGDRKVIAPDGKATTEREWSRALQVTNTPTLVFFEGGKEVFRSEGYLRPFHLESVLDYVASGAYRAEPSFQRYIRKRADAMRDAGKSVDLWR